MNKKYIIVFVIIFFVAFLYSRRMTNPGMFPIGATYSFHKCNGYYLSTTDRRIMDGPQSGFCFGSISKKTITQ